MRRSLVLSVVTVSLFGSALAVHRQDAPLAEKQFKNIQSFKGAKASDIIPSMQFMSGALKVDCDFCHTEDRASDDKNAKGTTREMIAMQRDINEKFFGGRNQVTCATCHAGHTHPVSVPPVEGSSVRVRRSADVEVSKVLAAFGSAVGGSPDHAIEGLEGKGTFAEGGTTSKLEATYSGQKFVFTVHMPKQDHQEGFNGALIWFTTPKGVQSVPLAYAAQYVRQNAIYTGVSSLPKLDSMAAGTAKIDDKDMLAVSGFLSADKTRVTMFFDKKTGLLARTQFSVPTILGNILQTNDYASYKKVDGVLLPMMITNHSSEGDRVLKFSGLKAVKMVADSTFNPPAK